MNSLKTYYQRNFLRLELLLVALITVFLVAYVEFWIGRVRLMEFLKGSRQATYGTLASVCASLLGFVLTAVSVILVFGQSPRLDLLRQSGQYRALFAVFFQAVLWLAISAVWSFVGLLTDTDCSPCAIVTYGMIFLSFAIIARVARCIWALRAVAFVAAGQPS